MFQKNKKKFSRLLNLTVFILALVGRTPHVHAETVTMPESRHQQFETYGLFFEQQSSLIYRSAARAWGAVGMTAAILEKPDWRWKPQLIAHASANAAYQLSATGNALLTQTIDARVGFGVDLQFSDKFRGMVLWTHQSGHISDEVADKELIGPNLGNEILTFRIIRDIDRSWRLGGGLRPMLGSDPGMMHFGAEQFAEWFPWGATQNPHEFSPFIAAGLEEYGRVSVDLTFHAQAGFALGDHFSESHHPGLRWVIGYYNGVDPRLKYFQFYNGKSEFGYLGVMLDL